MKFFILIIFFSTNVLASSECEPVFSQVDESLDECLYKNSLSGIAKFISGTWFWSSSKEPCSKLTHSNKKLNLTSEVSSQCKIVSTILPDKNSNIIQDDGKCPRLLKTIINQALVQPGNTLKVENYSEFCDPRELKANLYCCP